MVDDVDITVVTMRFDARDGARLGAVLAHYVMVSRAHEGCRTIDLCASVTTPGRLVVIEKWGSPGAQRAHFDSPEMVALAEACRELVAGPPEIELLAGVSAHDLI